MIYVEMRHSGISHDIKTSMEVLPRIGDIVDFKDEDDHHLFRVERVIHVYEDHKLENVYITGTQLSDWLS